MKCHLRIITGLYFVFLTIFVQNAHSKSNFPPLSLELEDTEIVSVSKEKEPAFKAAASVYVLSSDDIRRSGATNIPEALRTCSKSFNNQPHKSQLNHSKGSGEFSLTILPESSALL